MTTREWVGLGCLIVLVTICLLILNNNGVF
jgi:hypothetical protein